MKIIFSAIFALFALSSSASPPKESHNDASNYISFGQWAVEGQFPSVVFLKSFNSYDRVGVIVSERWVVSSGDTDIIDVFAGSTVQGDGDRYFVKQVLEHPMNVEPDFPHKIILIELTEDIKLGEKVEIADVEREAEIKNGDQLISAGWSDSSNFQKWCHMDAISIDPCNFTLAMNWTEDEACIRGVDGKIAGGDTGAALFKADGKTLVGIATNNNQAQFDIYTYVKIYDQLEWIDEVLDG